MRTAMRIVLLSTVLALASAVAASAQGTGTPSSKLAWVQTNVPDAATAQAFTYRYYPDTATTGTVLTGVTCTLTNGVVNCEVAFPAFTPGTHSLVLTAQNAAGEGPKSAALAFTFQVLPSAPTTLTIK